MASTSAKAGKLGCLVLGGHCSQVLCTPRPQAGPLQLPLLRVERVEGGGQPQPLLLPGLGGWSPRHFLSSLFSLNMTDRRPGWRESDERTHPGSFGKTKNLVMSLTSAGGRAVAPLRKEEGLAFVGPPVCLPVPCCPCSDAWMCACGITSVFQELRAPHSGRWPSWVLLLFVPGLPRCSLLPSLWAPPHTATGVCVRGHRASPLENTSPAFPERVCTASRACSSLCSRSVGGSSVVTGRADHTHRPSRVCT